MRYKITDTVEWRKTIGFARVYVYLLSFIDN